MRAIPANIGRLTRRARLRAMFARLGSGAQYVKDFGYATAYTAGRKVARGLDTGVRRTQMAARHAERQIAEGLHKLDTRLWDRVNKKYGHFSQDKRNRIFKEKQTIRNFAIGTGALAVSTQPLALGLAAKEQRKYERGYTKEERIKRKSRLRNLYTYHPLRSDKRYAVDVRIRDAAMQRAKKIKRMRRISS